MKTNRRFLIALQLFFATGMAFSQTGTFTFESGTDHGDYITQTVDSRTLTVTSSSGNLLGLYDGTGLGLSPLTETPQCYAETGIMSLTLTFSAAVNITTLYCLEANKQNYNWDFTPTGGSNDAKTNVPVTGETGTMVTLNFTNITAITITRNGGGTCYFGVDDIVMDASLPVELFGFSARSKGCSVDLEWTTQSETNNLGFIIARKDACSEWTDIASYRTDDALRSRGNTSCATVYTYTDVNVIQENVYLYRLSDVSTDGEITVYAPVSVTVDASPDITEMKSAYPNPFNPVTYIDYQLKESSHAEITVYDQVGRKIKTLFKGEQAAGTHHVYWNGTDTGNKTVSTGTYIIQMKTDKITRTQKVVFMK